jgi:hypothetical protein
LFVKTNDVKAVLRRNTLLEQPKRPSKGPRKEYRLPIRDTDEGIIGRAGSLGDRSLRQDFFATGKIFFPGIREFMLV